MTVLVLGATGMLGHMLWEEARKENMDAYATVRRIPQGREHLFPKEQLRLAVDAENYSTVSNVLIELNPDVVFNCIGIVKQSITMKDTVKTISINSLFPHLLLRDCLKLGTRLIHLSTDCVFSGNKGLYRESDLPDPVDFYGLSKLIGEPSGENVLVIRTSMIGPELEKEQGLLEWFLSKKGSTVRGYTNAVFSGLYTRSLARLILKLAKSSVSGLRNLSTEPISKYALLEKIRDVCKLPIEIVPDGSVHVDRSLDSTMILEECRLEIPLWNEMADLLAEDLRREGKT